MPFHDLCPLEPAWWQKLHGFSSPGVIESTAARLLKESDLDTNHTLSLTELNDVLSKWHGTFRACSFAGSSFRDSSVYNQVVEMEPIALEVENQVSSIWV